MGIGKSEPTVTLDSVLDRTTEFNILSYYLGINSIPCKINSPLRQDKNPSFGLYSSDGEKIHYRDFANRESGGTFDLLCKLWNCTYKEALIRVWNDIPKFSEGPCTVQSNTQSKVRRLDNHSELMCRVREWRDYDIEYWSSYGISLEWLKYAEVWPISHKIIIKDGHRYTFSADKYAYAYVEHKEGKVTLKIYQPFNKDGYKWSNKHDSSVISLWTKIPPKGDRVCICSSLKDALCLWANTGIPSISVQGEGYKISDTAISELKRRYKQVFILFDNDEAGLIDGRKLSESTGFTNVVLPEFEEYGHPKDVSDLFHALHDKEKFKEIMIGLFINKSV